MEDLAPEQRAALHALKGSRGSCASAETLIDYHGLDESGRARHAAHDHVQLCSRCQLVLLHLGEPEAVAAASSLRWLLPLAAVAILAVGATLLLPGRMSNVPPDTIRGNEILITAPLGSVDAVTAFSWQSPIRAERYRVTVLRGADPVWQADTSAQRLDAPAGVFEDNVEYRWSVEAIDREGEVRMTSPPQVFTVSIRRR